MPSVFECISSIITQLTVNNYQPLQLNEKVTMACVYDQKLEENMYSLLV